MINRSYLVSSVFIVSLFWQTVAVQPPIEPTESILNFTLRFSRAVFDDKNETQVASPFCLIMLLVALEQGVAGDSAKQIGSLIGMGSEDSKLYFRSVLDYARTSSSDDVFRWGNKMYVRNDLEINADFKENVKKNFEMLMEKVNFSGNDFAKNVNDWISLIIDGNIKDAVNPTFITPDTYLILVSAISFTDEWDNAFNVRNTEEDYFHVNEKTNVTVPFMIHKNRKTIMGRNNELGFKWIRLGYSKSPYMYILFILPTKRFGLNELMGKLSWDHLLQMIRGRDTVMANVEIPKFNITSHILLQQPLKKLGVVDIFTEKANLSRMINIDENVNVQDIIHNCNIEINEKGTAAAAVSSANFQFLSGTVEYPDNPSFKADEPFLFYLYDERILFPHFSGQVFNPLS